MIKNLENEGWIPVIGYDGGYNISNMGRFYSVKRDIIMKKTVNKFGYSMIRLSKNGVAKTYRAARLIGIHFIPNTENKRTINHKFGIRTDDRASELEWATDSEQVLHSYKTLGRKPPFTSTSEFNPANKKVKCDTLDMEFYSATEAAKALGGTVTDISNYISGKRTNRYGLTFRYL